VASLRLTSPAERYIRALVVHPDEYSSSDIEERLIDDGLDFISLKYIDSVRKKMPPRPRIFYPTDQSHQPSFMYICDNGINRFYIPDQTMRLSRSILEHARAKLQIEAMLMCGQTFLAISAALMHAYQIYATPDAVGLYKHYFWDTTALDVPKLRILLEIRYKVMEESIPEFKGRAEILRRAYYKDPRYFAVSMPNSMFSAYAVQQALGFLPPVGNIMESIDDLVGRTFHAAAQALMIGGPRASEEYANWLNAAQTLTNIQQTLGRPNDGLKGLETIALRTDPAPVPTLSQLSGGHGNHTAELVPMKGMSDGKDDRDEVDPDPGDEDGLGGAEGGTPPATPPLHEG